MPRHPRQPTSPLALARFDRPPFAVDEDVEERIGQPRCLGHFDTHAGHRPSNAARVLFRPIGSLLLDSQVDLPRTAFSIAMALVTAILAIGCYLLAGVLTNLVLPRAKRWLPLRANTTADRLLGGAGRALLATAAVAEGSTLLVNLAAFSVLAGPVHASILGRALITIWRQMYPGL